MEKTPQQLRDLGEKLLKNNHHDMLYINYSLGLVGLQRWAEYCTPGEMPTMRIMYQDKTAKKVLK